MLKRLILLLIAASMCMCAAATAEESLKNFPLTAAQCPVKITDYVPTHASDLADNGVASLLMGLFTGAAMERDDDAIYLVQTHTGTVSTLSATMTLRIGGYITRTVSGEPAQAPSGADAMRFEVNSASDVRGFTASLQNETDTASVSYDGDLQVTGYTLSMVSADVTVRFTLDASGQITHLNMAGDEGTLDATYEPDGKLDYAAVSTSAPSRIYSFAGSSLASIRDDDNSMIAYYDADTGMLMQYTVSTPVEGFIGFQRVTFSPYGDIIEIAYPRQTEDWSMVSVFWSPNFGWHLADEGDMDKIFDLDTSTLPDPASLTPLLPVAEKPAYRTDIRSIADLPTLPLHISELPEVLDLQVADGVATVTLSRSLSLQSAVPAIRNRWNPDSDVILALPTETAGVYAAEVGDSAQTEDLSFDIFIPANSVSEFSYGYAYDPLTKSWQVTVFSPAAEFVVECTPAGKPVTAELVEYLGGETDNARLTFDEESGELTSYEYYIELPFVHRGGWYAFTYIPGRGIVSAICGDRSTGRFVWTPGDDAAEGGWVDLVLNTSPEDLLDPLNFPFPYPFPQD